MALLITDLDPAMKTKYIAGLNKIIKKKLILENSLSDRQVIPVGKTFRIAYEVALSEGNEMFDYNGQLAEPGAAGYDYLEGTVRHRNVRIRVYGADLDFTDSDEKAFVNGVENEIRTAGEAEAYEQERMMFWDGSGRLGKFAASGASASGGVVTIVLDTAFTGQNATKYIRKGMYVDLYNGSTPITNGTGLKVLNRTGDTTFTVAGDATLASAINAAGAAGTGYVYKKNSYSVPEYYGLYALIGINNNTVLSIDRTAPGKEWFIPRVWYQSADGPKLGNKQAVNYDWEPKDLRKVIRDLLTSQNVEKSDLLIFCTSDVEDYMVQQQQNNGEQVVRGVKVDNWPYETVSFNGIPVLSSELAIPNAIFIANKKTMRKFNCRNLTWQYFGQSFWKPVANYDAYEAYAVERKENGIVEPMKNATLWNVKGIDD